MADTKTKVLIVEDDAAILEALRAGLEHDVFNIDVAVDGESALERAESFKPDLVLLDVALPKMSGIDVCKELRQRSARVGIIMMSQRDSEIDTVVGLEVGADDYVSKPYRMRELIARMRAVMRRCRPVSAASGDPEGVLEFGDVHLDVNRHEVKVRGVVTPVPRKEFELLAVLMANAGRVIPRDVLIARVWGDNYVGDTKTLDVHIKRLRSRVEASPSDPSHVLTVRGVGYKFEVVADRGATTV